MTIFFLKIYAPKYYAPMFKKVEITHGKTTIHVEGAHNHVGRDCS